MVSSIPADRCRLGDCLFHSHFQPPPPLPLRLRGRVFRRPNSQAEGLSLIPSIYTYTHTHGCVYTYMYVCISPIFLLRHLLHYFSYSALIRGVAHTLEL